MKWFKHYSDMHEGETIAELFEQMGHQGLSFFLLQEICAKKLEKDTGVNLTKDDCIFSFNQRIVRQKLRLSQKNVELLLEICQRKGQLEFEFSGNLLKIKMPILLDLLNSDSKKARQTRAEAQRKAGLDKEEDKEEDKDNINRKKNKIEDHWFYKFLFEELNYGDAGFLLYIPKIEKGFVNESSFRAWLDLLITAQNFQKADLKGQNKYIIKSIKDELTSRGVR